MNEKISLALDKASEFFAHRKGLLPLAGIFFILLNLLFQIIPLGWVTDSNLFLNVGIILAIVGFLIAWVL